jgi:hypothetical protein
LSKERRDISQRKIRKIKQASDEQTFKLDSDLKEKTFEGLKPNTKLFYTKISFGVSLGTLAGLFFVFFDISPELWFIVVILGLVVCVGFARYVLHISTEDVDQKRIWLSGTFTYVLLFIVVTSLVWMILSA